MATFGTYSAPDSLNPADESLSAEHEEQRLADMANAAENLVGDTYEDTRGFTDGKGFEGVFDDLDLKGIDRRTSVEGLSGEGGRVGSLVKRIRDRTICICEQSPEEYLGSLNNSSSANLDRQVIKYQNENIRTKMDLKNLKENASYSLSTAKLYRESIKASKEKVMSEWQTNKEMNEDVISERSDFRKYVLNNWVARKTGLQRAYDSRSAKIKKTWLGRNLHKKSKLAQIQDKLEPKLAGIFDDLDKTVNKIESVAEKRTKAMEEKLKIAYRGANTQEKKENFWRQLTTAVEHNNPGNHVRVDALGITGNIKDRQKYVDMLEALKRVDFIKNGLHAIGKSQEMNGRQKDVIDSTDRQQNIVAHPSNYKFKEVLSKLDKDVPVGKEKFSTSDLVKILEEEIHSNPGFTVNPYDGDPTSVDLMTDAYKLVLLISHLNTLANVRNIMDKKVQSQLKGWIKQNYEGEAVGNTEIYDKESDVEAEVNLIQGSGGLVDDLSKILSEMSVLKKKIIENPSNGITKIGAFKTKHKSKLDKLYNKRNDFLTNSKDFDDKNKNELSSIWETLISGADFVVETLESWREENSDNIKILKQIKSYNDQITKLSSLGYSKKDEERYKNSYEQKIIDLQSQITLSSSSLGQKVGELNSIKKLKIFVKKDSGSLESKNKVIKRLLVDDFQKEMEKKALDNMEKNDQFDMLSKCPKGMKVKVDYKVVNATKSIAFPKQMQPDTGCVDLPFYVQKVTEKNGQKVVYLQSDDRSKVITLMGSAIKDGKPMKNGYLKEISNTGARNVARSPQSPEHGNAGLQIMTTNMRIAA